MARLLELPMELLDVIMIMLALSPNGARDLIRASATCKRIMSQATQSDVLKVVNFQSLACTVELYVDNYDAHFATNDLLHQCVRAGNSGAESAMGKALLLNDTSLWDMVLGDNGLPGHQKLVRSFICNGSYEEIGEMRIPFFSYVISLLGYDVARASGVLLAITKLCCYGLTMRQLSNSPDRDSRLAPPPAQSCRERVLVLFDQLFPSSHV